MVRPCYPLRMTLQRGECTECGVEISHLTKLQRDGFNRSGRMYCSKTCSSAYRARVSSVTASRTNRKYASKRMTDRNPMARPEVRAKVSATLKEMRHKPPVQGGNGHQIPEPQRKLAEMLGWPTEVVVHPKDHQLPGHYKLDMAHPTMRVYVEVDGKSHNTVKRREADARRTQRLASLGWFGLRFSNREAMEHTAECAQTVWSTTSRWQARTPTS